MQPIHSVLRPAVHSGFRPKWPSRGIRLAFSTSSIRRSSSLQSISNNPSLWGPPSTTRPLFGPPSTYRRPSPNDPLLPQKHIKRLAPRKAIKHICPDPVRTVAESQIKRLDPSGARTWLFRKTNLDGAHAGDVLLVRQKNGDPFAGVCISIRRRGTGTAILLRGQLTRVGVEMWFKIYSPNVEGIEIVKRAEKRPRRARLTYMRKPSHDMGSVEGIVRQHQLRLAKLGAAAVSKPGMRRDQKTKK